MERKAVTATICRRDKSLTSPNRDPRFFVVLYLSATQSISRLMFVRSVLSTLTYRNHSPSAAGAISLTLLRYSWTLEMKSVSSAYIASQGKLMSAGGRRGRHPRKVRRAASRCTMKSTGDSESPCGVPTAVLNGADSASSTLTAMFVSDSRNRIIRTLSVSFSRRTINACKKHAADR